MHSKPNEQQESTAEEHGNRGRQENTANDDDFRQKKSRALQVRGADPAFLAKPLALA
jgi:hypothetical protein